VAAFWIAEEQGEERGEGERVGRCRVRVAKADGGVDSRSEYDDSSKVPCGEADQEPLPLSSA
jgi:hypothetical protein